MSLHKLSNQIQSQGRGSDSMLVHMSPREVGGLQQLAKAHGGSLSVNPKTGLVEAGFLEQVLPVVAAAAATYFTAGAAAPALATALGSTTAGGILAGAGAGALVSGATAAIQGKDAGQAALMGGLGGAIAGGTGAYTPAEAATEAAAVGADATQKAAVEAGTQTATAVPPPTAAGTQAASMPAGAGRNAALDAVARGQGVFPEGSAALPGAAPNQQALYAAEAARTAPLPTPGSDFYATSGPFTKAGILALPGLGATWGGEQAGQPGEEQYDPNNPMRWRLSSGFQGSTPVRPNPYYQANYSGYAQGGLAQLQGTMFPQSQQVNTQFATPTQRPTSAEVVAADYEPVEDPYTGQPSRFEAGGSVKKKKPTLTTAAKMAVMDPYEASIAGLGNAEYNAQMPSSGLDALKPRLQLGQLNLASGGISHLGGYSDGGRMLKGPGDGMSDSIPASIGNKQPARLADGEFVVPADVVSHLGNGSTDAGAKKLYGMMDKVRQARTGKKKQAPAVNPNKMMPA